MQRRAEASNANDAIVTVILFNHPGDRRPASAAAKQHALSFRVEDRKGALYLVRTGLLSKIADVSLAVDGREVARLKSPCFTRVEITPGPHMFSASLCESSARQAKLGELWFDCWEGEIVVMRLSASMDIAQGAVKIERSGYTDALRDELAGMDMTAPILADV